MQVTFHFDPSCPWTWLTSRWLLRAAEVEPDLEVGWAPFSLTHLHGDDEHADGRIALRVVQHLLAIEDPDGVAGFYEAFGQRRYRDGEKASVELARLAAKDAGLDEAAIAALEDESLDEAVALATDRAYAAAGPDVGSPVLHWTDDQAQDVWIFGPLFDTVPDAPCCAELWRGVRGLAVHPMFKELKRGRHAGPDLASS